MSLSKHEALVEALVNYNRHIFRADNVTGIYSLQDRFTSFGEVQHFFKDLREKQPEVFEGAVQPILDRLSMSDVLFAIDYTKQDSEGHMKNLQKEENKIDNAAREGTINEQTKKRKLGDLAKDRKARLRIHELSMERLECKKEALEKRLKPANL